MPTKGTGKEVVRLEEPIREALRERAKVEGVDKSTIMRRAIVKELGIKEDA
ncbi:ribbon-helix-helix protein, CopG family [Aeromicrobium sp. 9AM]|uniref:ribbon-helix-helix protein, CopG family n=1 Tax=Aeromicrobium sp. 9AM TaxID=2653126 RepID=UPI00135C4F69|nr:ribbon-helix-helix protein, CopG family [Aeromicrobium sp. 9AM]